jgi:hypothetical protein
MIMSKIVTSVLIATVFTAGALQMGTANAVPNDRDAVQSQRSGKQTDKGREFWERMNRNGS